MKIAHKVIHIILAKIPKYLTYRTNSQIITTAIPRSSFNYYLNSYYCIYVYQKAVVKNLLLLAQLIQDSVADYTDNHVFMLVPPKSSVREPLL
jgi:hypothetical protein